MTGRVLATDRDPGVTVQQKAIKGGLWLVASSGLSKVLVYVQTIILVRLLSPEDFGLMGLLFAVTGTLDVLTNSGVQSALIQRKTINKEILDTAWVISITRGISKCVLLFILAPYVASFYETPTLELILKLFALGYLFGGLLNIGTVYFSRDIDFRMSAISEQLTSFGQVIVTVILAFVLKNVFALVLGHVIGMAIELVVSYCIHPFRPSFRFKFATAKTLFSFGKHILLSALVIHIINKGDDALVGKVLGLDALGFYTLAYSLAVLPSAYITERLCAVTFATFSRLQDHSEALRRSYSTALRFVALLTIPASAGIAVLAPEIVQVVYGVKWMSMVEPLRVLCIFGAIRAIVTVSGSLFQGVGKSHYLTYVSTAQLVLMAIIIFPLTTRWNILGTGLAVTAPMALVQGWALCRTSEIIGMRLSGIVRILVPPTMGAMVMVIALLFVKFFFVPEISVFGLVSLVVVGAGVYTGAVVVLDREVIPEMRGVFASLRTTPAS